VSGLHTLAIFPLCLVLSVLPSIIEAKETVPTFISAGVHQQLIIIEKLQSEQKWEAAEQRLLQLHKRINLGGYEKALVRNYLAFIATQQNDNKQAIFYYNKIINTKGLPKSLYTSAYTASAQLYFMEERYEKCIEIINKGLERQVDRNQSNSIRQQSILLKAQAYFNLNQYEHTIKALNQLIAHSPTTRIKEHWFLLLIASHSELEQLDSMLDTSKLLLRYFPKQRYWLQLSNIYGQLNKSEERLATLNLAYQQGYLTEPDNIILLAQLLWKSKEPYQAALVLHNAMKYDNSTPDNPLTTIPFNKRNGLFLVRCWLSAKEKGNAFDTLSKLAKKLQLSEIYAMLAFYLFDEKDYAPAISNGYIALSLDTKNTNKQNNLKNKVLLQVNIGAALYETKGKAESLEFFKSISITKNAPSYKGNSHTQSIKHWVKFLQGDQTQAD